MVCASNVRARMTINKPDDFGGDFPPPDAKRRNLPLGWLLLAAALIALIALLALSY